MNPQRAKTIQESYHTLTPYMMFRDAAKAISFYVEVLQAKELTRDNREDGKIRHADIIIGDSHLMLSDETPVFSDMPAVETVKQSPVSLFLYLDEVDSVMERAIAGGAREIYPISDKPYGRSGSFVDPFGYVWHLTRPPLSAGDPS